jgi:hypothetical protein
MVVLAKTQGRYDVAGSTVKGDADERQTLRNCFPDHREPGRL